MDMFSEEGIMCSAGVLAAIVAATMVKSKTDETSYMSPMTTFALIGVGVDVWCKGSERAVASYMSAGRNIAAAVAGGTAVRFILNR
jgi:precorrin-2 methylase